MPLTPRAVELLNHIAHARNTNESILDYGHYATDLQRELLLIVDTCSNRTFRFTVRRLATAMSLDMMSSTMDDSLQMQFYLDSILTPYQQVSSHWYIEQIDDTLTEFTCEPYIAEDSDVYVFYISLLFNNKGKSFATISYPHDAKNSPSLMFANEEYFNNPNYIFILDEFNMEEEGVIVIPPSKENYLTLFIPMETLLPQLLNNHTEVVLSYMSDKGNAEEGKHKVTELYLEEFKHQFEEWNNKINNKY